MLPELKPHYDNADNEMSEAYEYVRKQLSYLRAGKASPNLLDGVKVEYYGMQTPLNQLAHVSAPDPRMLTVEPFDKSAMGNIEKAIQAAGLGLNPNNDGNLIRIPLPTPSEERRQELVKKAKEIAEEGRISVRNARRDAKDNIKKQVKTDSLPEDSMFESEEELQKLTDSYIKKIDDAFQSKEEEILTV